MRLQGYRTVKWTYSEERNKSRVLILTAMTWHHLYIVPIHAIKDIRRPVLRLRVEKMRLSFLPYGTGYC
jgi:hypothetical protein